MHFLKRIALSNSPGFDLSEYKISPDQAPPRPQSSQRDQLSRYSKLMQSLDIASQRHEMFGEVVQSLTEPGSGVHFNFIDRDSFLILENVLKFGRAGQHSFVIISEYVQIDAQKYCDKEVIIDESILRSTKQLTDEVVEILKVISKDRGA